MIDGKTKICGIMGNPLGHSLSPQMHNAAFSKLGLNFAYLPFQVEKENLEKAVEGIKAFQIRGINVTVPHKVRIMKFLDEVDEIGLKIGAVNTIVNEKGALKGFNTDARGFKKALEKEDVKLEGKKIMVLGAGGAGRAIAFQCALEKSKVTIVNRTLEKAEKLQSDVKSKLGKEIEVLALSNEDRVKEKLKEADVMINATSVGMKEEKSIIPREFLRSELVIMDVVYNPVETKLLTEAKKAKCKKIINGVEMLVQQGALSFEIWTGKKAPVDLMREIIMRELKGK